MTTLASLTVVLAGMVSAQQSGQPAQTQPGKAHAGHHDAAFEKCAKACADCALECDSCGRHCMEMVAEGKKEHLKTARTCADCAAICQAAACSAAKQGPLAGTICEACAKVCDACGNECDKFPNDEHMKKCARTCHDCAKACRDMVAHAGH